MRLHERIAVITGGAAGIGRAIAQRFSDEGAVVVIADVDVEAGRAAVSALAGAGRGAEFVALDVSDVEATRQVVDAVVERHGRLDVMVNNAGLTRDVGFFDVQEADWDLVSSVDAKGVLFGQQAAARHMVERRSGAIINISSISGKGWPNASSVVYASAKGAVLTMTRIAASQLAPHGVRVNAICPGITQSELLDRRIDEIAAREDVPREEVYERFLGLVPLRRLAQPEDVAATALFLASDEAAMITGQSVNVDGGVVWD